MGHAWSAVRTPTSFLWSFAKQARNGEITCRNPSGKSSGYSTWWEDSPPFTSCDPMAPRKCAKARTQWALSGSQWSQARAESTPEAFSSWREIHTGYYRHTAAAATPQWATHAHAAILWSTVATATRATAASLLTLTLPHAEVQTFDGDPVNYCNFIRSFENLIEAKMKNSSTRLYYLVQYTFGDVQELTWSCLSMQPEEGYQEAQRLFKARYGQNHKIVTTYVSPVTNGPLIRHKVARHYRSFLFFSQAARTPWRRLVALIRSRIQTAYRGWLKGFPFS